MEIDLHSESSPTSFLQPSVRGIHMLIHSGHQEPSNNECHRILER